MPTQEAFRQTNLKNEPADYLAKREELRIAEIELMRMREHVAEMRRNLPPGAIMQDYVFEEGPLDLNAGDAPVHEVHLRELFTGLDRSLLMYHLMFGKKNKNPCPMCTALVDSLNGVACHIAQRADLVIVAAASLPELRAHARARGWNRLRLLSAAGNHFKYDMNSEDREGNQDAMLSVFNWSPEGEVRHFYSAHPAMAHEIRERGLDLLGTHWHVFDYTPQGRGEFTTKLAYPNRDDLATRL